MATKRFSEAAATALKQLNTQALDEALKPSIDINAVNAEGETLLHIAAWAWDRPELLQRLLALGANIDARASDGATALYRAVDKKRIENVRALLEAGADVDIIQPKSGGTALFRAIYTAQIEMALALLDKSHHVNVEAKNDGGTPLLWAVGLDSPELVQKLVERGADPKMRSNDASMPLDDAVYEQHEEVAALLRDALRRAGAPAVSRFDISLPRTKSPHGSVQPYEYEFSRVGSTWQLVQVWTVFGKNDKETLIVANG